jgi:transcription elongation GreA/GreB family factor
MTGIAIGSIITIEDEKGKPYVFTLVPSDQVDLSQNKISIESPLGKALLGRCVGETAIVQTPRTKKKVKIIKIKNNRDTNSR